MVFFAISRNALLGLSATPEQANERVRPRASATPGPRGYAHFHTHLKGGEAHVGPFGRGTHLASGLCTGPITFARPDGICILSHAVMITLGAWVFAA